MNIFNFTVLKWYTDTLPLANRKCIVVLKNGSVINAELGKLIERYDDKWRYIFKRETPFEVEMVEFKDIEKWAYFD